jgi:adenylylsulfate kinase
MAILLQMTGLSGAGKTTLAQAIKERLIGLGYQVEIIDGDVYRKNLCRDLGFSKKDRLENVRRLGQLGLEMVEKGIITILAVINPYEEARSLLAAQTPDVKTVYIECPITILKQRDTKGLYRRALLLPTDPDYIAHFTGISDPYEPPQNPDLTLHTNRQSLEISSQILVEFIIKNIKI